MTTIIETERLILRTWDKEDVDPYFQINQDPKVTEFLRGPLTMAQVNDFIPMVNNHQAKHGYTVWATDLKETGELIGSIGLYYVDWESHFTSLLRLCGDLDLGVEPKDMLLKAQKLL